MARRRALPVLALLAALAGGLTVVRAADDPYTVDLVMPSADTSFVGGNVMIAGQRAGQVTEISARDGQAIVTVEIDDDHAPLPSGTTARISWQSTLGARLVELVPGDKDNPPIRSGALVTDAVERVELDDVLAALDEPTRKNLQSLLGQLDGTLEGKEEEVNATIRGAGPALEALGAILEAVGDDGPALKALVSDLRKVTANLAENRTGVSDSVAQLRTALARVSGEQDSIRKILKALPGTIDTATTTLAAAPGPIDDAREIIGDLSPVVARLPKVARQLEPVLTRLPGVLDQLQPTLVNVSALLDRTPRLLNDLTSVGPQATAALEEAGPMVTFLRPYTPELIGWLSNWVSVFMGHNASGNFGRALVTVSGSSVVGNPGIPIPGLQYQSRTAPGELVGQPWTDANGDEIR